MNTKCISICEQPTMVLQTHNLFSDMVAFVNHVWQCMVCTQEESQNECETLFPLVSEDLPAHGLFRRE